MPITPLHFGPGLIAGAAFGPRFGLMGFLVSQVLLDLEPGIKMLGLEPEGVGLHTEHLWSLAPWYIARATSLAWLLGIILAKLRPERFSRPRAWVELFGAIIGVVSHLLLDAIYHSDVAANLGLPGLNGLVSQGVLDGALAITLVVGLALLRYKSSTAGTGYLYSFRIK